MRTPILKLAGLVGSVVGAAIGYWGVGAIAQQGFHAIVLPAGLPGIVAGVVSRERSPVWASLYFAIGVVAALFTEWKYRPFVRDSSLGYFVRHIGDLQPMVLVIIGVGAAIGAVLSVSFGHRRRVQESPSA